MTGLTGIPSAVGIASIGQIPSTATNDAAAAGKVGEVISSDIPSSSSITVASNTATNITSISLTAGDWDVSGTIATAATATILYLVGGASGTTGTLPARELGVALNYSAAPGTNADNSYALPVVRFSLASTTSVFLVVQQGSTGSSALNIYGYIFARRSR